MRMCALMSLMMMCGKYRSRLIYSVTCISRIFFFSDESFHFLLNLFINVDVYSSDFTSPICSEKWVVSFSIRNKSTNGWSFVVAGFSYGEKFVLGIWLQWILENRMKFYSDDEHYWVSVQSTKFFCRCW